MADCVFIRLCVRGKPEDIAEFRAKAASSDETGLPTALSFEPFIPTPTALKAELGDKEAEVFRLLEDIRAGEKRALNSRFALEHGIQELVELEAQLQQAKPDAFAVASRLQRQLDALEHRSWRDWRDANWGTKWDAGNVSLVKEGPEFLLYRFETPWTPPSPVIKAMSLQHPFLKFQVHVEFEAGATSCTEDWLGGELVGWGYW